MGEKKKKKAIKKSTKIALIYAQGALHECIGTIYSLLGWQKNEPNIHCFRAKKWGRKSMNRAQTALNMVNAELTTCRKACCFTTPHRGQEGGEE